LYRIITRNLIVQLQKKFRDKNRAIFLNNVITLQKILLLKWLYFKFNLF